MRIVASLTQTDEDKQRFRSTFLTFGLPGILHFTSILGTCLAKLGTPDLDLVPVPQEDDLIKIGQCHDKLGG